MSDDGLQRCSWCGDDPLYRAYHDEEWGLPCRDEGALFELLMLEGMQAGLSWITILRKREGFRAAFASFDPHRIARFDEADRQRLLADAGIVRNRAKVDAVIGNARALLALRAQGLTLTELCWEAVDGRPLQNRFARHEDVPAQTPASNDLSRRLRGLGFRFVGPTICYAFMQAAGLVNDHLLSCHRHRVCARVGTAA